MNENNENDTIISLEIEELEEKIAPEGHWDGRLG